MLIDDVIRTALDCGHLVAAKPVEPWAPEPRAVLMCRPLRAAIEAGRIDPDPAVRRRWAQLEADIGTFIVGGLVTDGLLKHLRPAKFEHWELISRRPRPSLRVFGRFAKPDVFVGTHVRLRKDLGGMNSAQFEHEKRVCEDHWRAAGLPTQPPPGAFTDAPAFRYEAYVTENARKSLRISP